MRAAFIAACLYAGSALGVPPPGFYAGADIGFVDPTVGAGGGIVVMAPGLFPVGVLPDQTRSEGSETSWSVAIGYRMNRYLAGELVYVDFGPVDIVEVYDLCEEICAIDPSVAIVDTASHVKGPLISVLGILPMGERFEVFARAGVLFGAQELNLTSGPGVLRGPRLRNAVEPWVFGAGIAFHPGSRWSARVEYQSVEELPANAITGSVRQERYALGLGWRF
jgi:hypothetical protein